MSLDISNILEYNLSQILTKAIENNNILKQNDDLKKILNWYDELESKQETSKLIMDKFSKGLDLASLILSAKHNQDDFFSKLSTMLVTKLLENIPKEFANVMINNIKIQTVGKEHGIKFDFESEFESIKPFIEFIKKINGIQIDKTTIKFQIDTKINIKDVEIMSNENERRINLGKLTAKITISIMDKNMQGMDVPHNLLVKSFKADLSEIHIPLEKNSSKMVRCKLGHENPQGTKYCGKCGRLMQ